MAPRGRWCRRCRGGASCHLKASGEPIGRLDGFTDLDETVEILTHPMVGWYRRHRGAVGRYSVWHDVLALAPCRVEDAHFEVFEGLGLVEPGAEPHSAVVLRTVHFDVHTPPTKVRD